MADARLGGGPQFGDGAGGFFLREGFAVPAFFVLEEGDASALKGLGEDNQGLGAQADGSEDLEDFLGIVPIDFLGAPAEGLEAFFVGVEVVAQGGRLALAETVDIHDGDEVVQLMMAGQGSGFPDRAFGAFPIAEQDVCAVVQAVQAGAQGHADPDAEPLAERAGRYVHKGQARRRMPLEVGPELAELEEVLGGEKTGLGPGGVKQRGGMAFGENETVIVMVMRVFGVVAHVAEEQGRDQIGRRAARGGMAAGRRGCRRNRVNSQLVGDALQRLNINIIHGWRKLYAGISKRKAEIADGQAGVR